MPQARDLAGRRFGRLIALEMTDRNLHNKIQWRCACDCGGEIVTTSSALQGSRTTSCGCLRRENAIAKIKSRSTHGMSRDPIYTVWSNMLGRCYSPANISYKNYGARGITVCQAWSDDFLTFYRDVGDRPFPGAQLDRIENDGDYEPGYVQWSTRKENGRNTRHNRLLSFRGETKPLSAWAEQTGLNYGVLRNRLKLGWDVERALSTPVLKLSHD